MYNLVMTKDIALNLFETVAKLYLGTRGKDFSKQEADTLYQAIDYLRTLEPPQKTKAKK